jgi:hypothetical protein
MKRKIFIFPVLILAIIISVMFMYSANLFAKPSIISFNGNYYEMVYSTANWTGAKAIAESMTHNGLKGHLVTITSEDESKFISANFSFNDTIWIGAFQKDNSFSTDSGWSWVTGEKWKYENWAGTPEPNDGGPDYFEDNYENYVELFQDGAWNDAAGFYSKQFIVEYDKKPTIKKEASQPQSWVRDHEMQCWQVWINGANQFEFLFFWPYYSNNWIKIYDTQGNEVFSIDMPKGDPHFTADLPDGMYTVKTFHDGFEKPLQEFVIGKP